jgi:hypothetical protein
MLIYREWIINRHLHIPEVAQAKCVETCKDMQEVFPELSIVKGVVFSHTNLDNYGDTPTEYPHCWLIDKNGGIVDPTRSQFILLGKLEYKSHTDAVEFIDKCRGCGTYFDSRNSKLSHYCGECKWSYEV